MRSHIIAHRATTKFFLSSFIFRNEIEKEGLPRGSAPGLGARSSTPTTPPITSEELMSSYGTGFCGNDL